LPADGTPSRGSAPLPELLHATAPHAVWRHVWRSVLRVTVLVFADLATIEWLRIALVAGRDAAWFGEAAAAALGASLPASSLPGVPLQLAILLGLAICGAYVGGARKRHLNSVALGAVLGVLFMTWTELFSSVTSARLLGVATMLLTIVGALVAMRFVLDIVVDRIRPRAALALRTILVAPHRDLNAARRDPAYRDRTEFRFVGEVNATQAALNGGPLGPTAEMMRLIDEHRADTVVLYGRLEAEVAARLARVADAAGCNVVMLPRTAAIDGFDTELVFHHGDPLLRLVRPGERGRQLVVKRAFDIVASLILLVALSPLFVLVALAVRLTSRGPALFKQTRVGQGGRYFQMWKFRSMVRSAEQQFEALLALNVYGDQPYFKLARDPRITPLGRFLRRSSLDELPQLWNVLRGEMSLVGPRPSLLDDLLRYRPHHFIRLDVLPGLTGPWQVSGRSNIMHFDDVVALESDYIGNWSMWRDMAILLRTLPAVIRMDGAA
jgi:exopolysaccharide biosynthesis polyprenyl glycosylphosphotransferase